MAAVLVACGPPALRTVENTPPDVAPLSLSTAEDTPVTGTLAATDADGDPLTLALGAPSHGTATSAELAVTYTPAANFVGVDTFMVTISDGTTEVSSMVTITVGDSNDAPVANDDAFATPEDTALDITAAQLIANDTDADGDTLTVTAVSGATSGTVSLDGADVTFTPAVNFHGDASFAYTISDGTATATATATITVGGTNDAPVGVADALTTSEDTLLVVSAATLTANDSDPDGQTATITQVGNASSGNVTLDGGNVRYMPAANFNGTATFDYTLSDGMLTDTVEVTVTITPVNDAPVAVDDAVATQEDTALTFAAAALTVNDTDVDGNTLAATAVANASHGSVQLVAGAITFTPSASFAGAATFEYTVSDGAKTDVGLVTVTVTPVNDPPVAVNDSATVSAGQTYTVAHAALLANDSDPEGSPLSITAASNAVHGSVALGASTITFTPTPGFVGTASFRYTVSDGGLTATATVTLTYVDVVACGDGVISGTESCDDGGTEAGDGCSATCAREPGFSCTGEPSVCTPDPQGAAILISEYVEGSGNSKAIELRNLSSTGSYDLTAHTCALENYANGNAIPNFTVPLTGTIAPDDVRVFCDDGSAAALLAVCDVPSSSSAFGFNGNDALVLRCDDDIVDVVGQIGSDPGVEWGTGLTSTADNTLRRTCSVTAGDTNGANTFDPSGEWDGFAKDTFAGLGVNECLP